MAKVDPYNSWDINGDQDSFDSLLSLFDFPMESLEGDGLVGGGDWDVNNSQYLGPIPGAIPSYDPIAPLMISQTKTEPVFLHGQVGLNEVAPESKQLLPYRFEDTSCIRRQYEVLEQSSFQSQSPVSVLENGAGKSLLINSHVRKRTRTKRARPSVNPWLLLSPVFSAGKNRETRKKSSHVERAKKTFPDSPQRSSVAKKCAHCEVTKTPQWREGPMGPKTLCNACGVRYRSGRLYPEYRPAASPTFVPSLHSNSHKKVVEMRTKTKQPKVEDFGNFEFFPVSGYL
ncbi:hypothetical protein ACS0TY_014617 [Phlomoides rotata]